MASLTETIDPGILATQSARADDRLERQLAQLRILGRRREREAKAWNQELEQLRRQKATGRTAPTTAVTADASEYEIVVTGSFGAPIHIRGARPKECEARLAAFAREMGLSGLNVGAWFGEHGRKEVRKLTCHCDVKGRCECQC